MKAQRVGQTREQREQWAALMEGFSGEKREFLKSAGDDMFLQDDSDLVMLTDNTGLEPEKNKRRRPGIGSLLSRHDLRLYLPEGGSGWTLERLNKERRKEAKFER
jgi:hypothetical protein